MRFGLPTWPRADPFGVDPSARLSPPSARADAPTVARRHPELTPRLSPAAALAVGTTVGASASGCRATVARLSGRAHVATASLPRCAPRLQYGGARTAHARAAPPVLARPLRPTHPCRAPPTCWQAPNAAMGDLKLRETVSRTVVERSLGTADRAPSSTRARANKAVEEMRWHHAVLDQLGGWSLCSGRAPCAPDGNYLFRLAGHSMST